MECIENFFTVNTIRFFLAACVSPFSFSSFSFCSISSCGHSWCSSRGKSRCPHTPLCPRLHALPVGSISLPFKLCSLLCSHNSLSIYRRLHTVPSSSLLSTLFPLLTSPSLLSLTPFPLPLDSTLFPVAVHYCLSSTLFPLHCSHY